MYSLAILGAAAFVVALLAALPARHWFRRYGIIDAPDRYRKFHTEAIPRAGGIVILIGCLASVLVLELSGTAGSAMVRSNLQTGWKLLPAALLVFATGLLDDLLGLKPLQKLAGQFAAAIAVCLAGIYIRTIAGQHIEPWLGIPLTIIWLLACTNAFNLIDGVDGLATGVGLIAAVTMLLAGLLQNNTPLALAAAPLVGALLGLLRYNFNPATIFLGDSGSLLIGFSLGCFGILWNQKSTILLDLAAPVMALAIPLLDTAITVARRILRNQPVFFPDRRHIHHRLLDRGFTPWKAVLALYGASALFGILALLTIRTPNGLVLGLFCGCACVGIRYLRYREFDAAGRMFTDGSFRRSLNTRLAILKLEEGLAACRTPEECWTVLETASNDFGLCGLEWHAEGKIRGTLRGVEDSKSWELRVPLVGTDYAVARIIIGQHSHHFPAFVDILQKAMGPHNSLKAAAKAKRTSKEFALTR